MILNNLTTTFRKAATQAFRTPAGRPEKMEVKELIAELQKQDPEKEVMIQQGEEFDYMKAYTVKEAELWDADAPEEDDIMEVVVIEYS